MLASAWQWREHARVNTVRGHVVSIGIDIICLYDAWVCTRMILIIAAIVVVVVMIGSVMMIVLWLSVRGRYGQLVAFVREIVFSVQYFVRLLFILECDKAKPFRCTLAIKNDFGLFDKRVEFVKIGK